jgi:hypothetical protein
MKHRCQSHLLIVAFAVLAGVVSLAALRGCHGGQRLVEVFNNGPVGGPPGGSDGYRWVRADDLPSAGKSWKPVDIDTLTPEQRKRIR